ncbi:trimethylguanosine synthase [Coniella lustricola]|uniref:Trimethylguanosine synthase n=1 Tax=Coniella lustricola TaxID=2025994 RepID=A0A2T3AGV6_9PEZI|nr:trimethylguanosine synthase [Coniella lustricola]
MVPSGALSWTEDCKHYEDSSDMPEEIKKYWWQRKDLFRRYDEDIHLTDKAWFGVTPEPIAQEIAEELARKNYYEEHPPTPRIIVDLFAGAGGNTIAFAQSGYWDVVIGIEIDAATLACAQHNARVYGVNDRITWIHGDCADFMHRLKHFPWTLEPSLQVWRKQPWPNPKPDDKRRFKFSARTLPLHLADLCRNIQLFASPPWGGPVYKGAEVLDLDAMEPFGVNALHTMCAPLRHALFLPRNGDLKQLAGLMPNDTEHQLDVVQYCVRGVSKGLVAYYPVEEGYRKHEDKAV